MFPLKRRKTLTYVFGSKTFYSNFHLGVDYDANYELLYAPFNGEIVKVIPKAQAPDGGNTIWFKPDHDNVLIRFLHLDRFLKGQGRVREGEQIAITGNTGKSNYPHLHLDISKGYIQLNNIKNFIDPEKYNWEPRPMYPIDIKVTVVFNGGIWPTAPSKVQQIRNWYLTYSGNKINLIFTVKGSNFSSVPVHYNDDGSAVIDEPWFDANVLDPQAHTTILVIRDEDLPDYFPGENKPKLLARTRGYPGKVPTKTLVACSENELSEIYPSINAFIDYVEHELMHTCHLFAGGAWITGTNGQSLFLPGGDNTHKYFYDLRQPEGAFVELDYQRIINTLKGALMAQIKTQAKGASRRILLEAADWNEWVVLCKVYGKDPNKPEETV